MDADIIYPPGENVAILRSGERIPIGPRQLSPSEIVAQIRDVVARPYMGRDAGKIGMSLLEAAMTAVAEKAADGDLDAFNKLLDRLMGKPLQQTIQATGTLREFLDQLTDPDSESGKQIDPFAE